MLIILGPKETYADQNQEHLMDYDIKLQTI